MVLQQEIGEVWRPIPLKGNDINREMVRTNWACERSSDYVVSKAIHIVTDHEQLIPVLTTHMLDQLTPRIQRMRMRLMRFNFKEVKHTPGQELCVSSSLYRLENIEQAAKSPISDDEMKVCFIQSIPV